uniref:Uncharacterized protein n=1 Tax=Vitis vinifera TaxID=29760 RepID=A5BHJ9_VITVI|nr:hypothetical protein VITISV_035748 [Vitis vinifera]
MVYGSNHQLIETCICVLTKLGKDRTLLKLVMVKASIIDKCLELLPVAPSSLCSSIAELFRTLTYSSAISKGLAVARIVEPSFMVLLRPDFSMWGQHSALQVLVNILEKSQSLATLKLTPSQPYVHPHREVTNHADYLRVPHQMGFPNQLLANSGSAITHQQICDNASGANGEDDIPSNNQNFLFPKDLLILDDTIPETVQTEPVVVAAAVASRAGNFVKMKATDVNLNGIGNGNLCSDGDYKNAVFIFGDRSKESCAFLERMAYMKKRVGQFAWSLEQGNAFAMQSLTDDEYFCFALVARRFQGPFVITALFREFAESYSSLEVHETTSTCSFLMSIEGHNPSGCYLTPSKALYPILVSTSVEALTAAFKQKHRWRYLDFSVLGFLKGFYLNEASWINDALKNDSKINSRVGLKTKLKVADKKTISAPLLHLEVNPESNVYSFEEMLLEIISGKVFYNEKPGPRVNHASEYLNDKKELFLIVSCVQKQISRLSECYWSQEIFPKKGQGTLDIVKANCIDLQVSAAGKSYFKKISLKAGNIFKESLGH